MPIYVYKCKRCSKREDRIRPIADRDELMLCQECGGPMARVLATGVGWNWATNAAAHGEFIKETRPGHSSVVPVSRKGKRTTR